MSHCHGSLVRVVEIPLPGMIGHKLRMVACESVEYPIGGSHMRIVVGTIHGLRRLFVPASPTGPVEGTVIVVRRHLIGLVVEQALAHAVCLRTFRGLQSSP